MLSKCDFLNFIGLNYFFNGIKSKKKKSSKLFYIFIFALTSICFFLTILFQASIFVESNFNKSIILLWALLLLLLIFYDYQIFMRYFAFGLLFLSPFLIYLIIAKAFAVNSINSGLTRMIFLSMIMFVIGASLSNIYEQKILRFFLFLFLISSIILSITIFFGNLIGYSLSNPIYAYSAKNATGPILFCGIVVSHFLFSKQRKWFYILEFFVSTFFVVIIALIKCRSVLICLPFLIIYILFDIFKTAKGRFVVFLFLIILVAFIIFVKPVYNLLIVNILLNNKNIITLDDLFSGRIASSIEGLTNLKPLLGNGSTYIDCMPISALCTFGIFGFLSLFPIFFYLVRICFNKNCSLKTINSIYSLLLFVFLINSLLEGYGIFGPGAKVFLFWIVCGFYSHELYLCSVTEKTLLIKESNIEKKITSNMFSIIVIVLSCSFSCFAGFVKPNKNTLAKTMFNIFPSALKTVEYIEPEKVSIINAEKMCVGQKRSFESVVSPSTATDKQVGWVSYDTRMLEVDTRTGNGQAKRTGNVNVHAISLRNKKAVDTKLIEIVSADEYAFDNIYLGINDNGITNQNIDVSVSIGDSIQLLYDKNYVPSSANFSFVSSDDSICKVDNNNVFIAEKKGVCIVTGVINNSIGEFISKNQIIITINDDRIIEKPSKIISDIQDEYYVKDSFLIEPLFFDSNGSSENINNKYFINTSDNIYLESNNTLRCLRSGDAWFEIISQVDNNVHLRKSFHVKETKPKKFILKNQWWVVGTKNKLELFIEYDNGKIHPATYEDIVIPEWPFEYRAFHNKNGIADDYFTRVAITSIPYEMSFTSSVDPTVVGSFTVNISTYSEASYFNYVSITSFFISSFIMCFAYCISCSVKKYKRIYRLPIFFFFNIILYSILFAIYKNYFIFIAASLPLVFSVMLELFLKKKHIDCINLFVVHDRKQGHNILYEVNI